MVKEVLIFAALFLIVDAALVIRALASGRWGFGAYAILRREHPGDYWFYIVMARLRCRSPSQCWLPAR